MTNKERLECIFSGQVPDRVPHFELDFYMEKELFGIDRKAVKEKHYSSEKARNDALLKDHIDVMEHLVEELDYASVYFNWELPPELGIKEVKKALGSKTLVRTHEWDGVYWMPTGEEFMPFISMMYERPEEMHANARRKCDAAIERLRKHADLGADFFMLCYDFGFNTGPFIAPEQFAEFVTPYLTEIVQSVHDMGLKAMLHSDGDIDLLLDEIYSTGIDGLQSVDPQGGMDIQSVREKFPDLILMGNVNCGMLQETHEEEIRESVRYCMQHGGVGKRYIFSTSNCIYPGMPPQSYKIMLDEYHKLADNQTSNKHSDERSR